jgi:hypothetical protein
MSRPGLSLLFIVDVYLVAEVSQPGHPLLASLYPTLNTLPPDFPSEFAQNLQGPQTSKGLGTSPREPNWRCKNAQFGDLSMTVASDHTANELLCTAYSGFLFFISKFFLTCFR